MKQFFKLVFASMLGTSLAFFVSFFMFAIVAAGIAGLSEKGGDGWKSLSGKDKNILAIRFDGPLVDRMPQKDVLETLFSDEPPPVGLYELTQTLRAAAQDEQIKGVFLVMDQVAGGMANVEALRRELVSFKNTGKFVIAYAENYTEKAYVLATAADEVILYPRGFFEWNGMYSKQAYVKGTLAKLDVVPQVFRAGKYKSAIEPLINDKMSPESREQLQSIILSIWGQVVEYAAEKTGKTPRDLESLANELSVLYAKDAFENKFVDFLSSFEDVEKKLMELTEAKEKPGYYGWRAYHKQLEDEKNSDNKVAIVFAEGMIVSGKGDKDQIASGRLSPLLRKIARDEKVKSVVIRVNSGGGSALASDVILTSTQHLKDKVPVVTSFGNVAASGGYYMSAGSSYIFAEKSTITGSIGVFGASFATKDFWNGKVGMTFDTEKSHRFADLEALVRPLDAVEKQKMQSVVDTIYGDFLNVVVQGREPLKTTEQAHEIAQGRVWVGKEAKDIGLVDEFGGVEEAIVKAAELASLEDYDVVVYPKPKTAFEDFVEQFGQTSVAIVESIVPKSLLNVINREKPQGLYERVRAEIPFSLDIQ